MVPEARRKPWASGSLSLALRRATRIDPRCLIHKLESCSVQDKLTGCGRKISFQSEIISFAAQAKPQDERSFPGAFLCEHQLATLHCKQAESACT